MWYMFYTKYTQLHITVPVALNMDTFGICVILFYCIKYLLLFMVINIII